MCNAWNHSPGCQCGWGGEGHRGRRSTGNVQRVIYPVGIPPIRSFIESYTIPNAICPVCGDSVFYYKNEHGSSVFFDELGPPWSKHPCTDRSNNLRPRPLGSFSASPQTKSLYWKEHGWAAYDIVSLTEFSENSYKFELRNLESRGYLTLYATSVNQAWIAELCPITQAGIVGFVEKVDSKIFRISILTSQLRPKECEAYASTLHLPRNSSTNRKKGKSSAFDRAFRNAKKIKIKRNRKGNW